MAKNKLFYQTSKIVGGVKYVVHVSLDDDCKNGHIDFHCGGDAYQKNKYGRWEWFMGGCIHDEILQHFPQLKCFVDLHCSNTQGTPLFGAVNGFYHLERGEIDTMVYSLRLSKEECDYLIKHAGDKEHFRYLLVKLGVPERWKKEAEAAIKYLEELTGEEFDDTSTRLEVVSFTSEEMSEFEKLIESGYYTVEAIHERKEAAKQKAKEKKITGLIADCESEKAKLDETLAVKLYIINAGLLTDNFIYYHHKREVVFNWLDYTDKITQEEFVDFVNSLDYSKLPEGIKFSIK